MYAEHRRSSGDKPCCPLCRVDWSLAAVRALREDPRRQVQEKGGGRRRGNAGAAAAAAASTRAPAVAPVTCRSCSVKVQAAFFRCLVCTPVGSWVSQSQNQASWVALWWACEISFLAAAAAAAVPGPPPPGNSHISFCRRAHPLNQRNQQDLCRRCYAMSGSRRSNHGGGSGSAGSCVSVGRHRHPFVQGEAAADPPEWTAAEPPDSGRRAAGTGGGSLGGSVDSAATGLLSLQVRHL